MAFSASDISKAAFLAVIYVLTVLGNALVAYVLVKNRRALLKNRPTYQFILNIVLSDLFVGLLTMPFEFTRELLDEWIFGTAPCKIIEYIEIAVFGTAVFTHALIAYDRYRSLARPYSPRMEEKLVRKMIALSWVVPAVVKAPYLYMFEVQVISSKPVCTPKAISFRWLEKLYEAFSFLFVLFLPFLVLSWCYFHVIRTIRGRSPTVVAENFFASQYSVIFRTKKRVTRTSGLVATAFVVCWLPTLVLSWIRIVSGTDSIHRGHVLNKVAMFGAFINEVINPVIYCAFDRSLKARIFPRVLCRDPTLEATGFSRTNESLAKNTRNHGLSFRDTGNPHSKIH